MMNRIFTVTILFLLTFLSCQGQGIKDKMADFDFESNRIDKTLMLEDAERHFIVHVPEKYTGETAVSLVFMFHGTGGDGDRFWRISRWKEMAEKEGFIAVFPTALKVRYEEDGIIKNKTKWNDGKIETMALDPSLLKDDVAFVQAILDLLFEEYEIDENQIFASGFSNGANFVSRLAVEMPETFAAIAAASGGLQVDTEPDVLIPYYQIAGSVELSEKTGEPAPSTAEELVAHPFIEPILAKVKTTFQLGDAIEVKEGKNHITLRFSENLGDEDNVYIFSLVKGLEHKYPNGDNNPAGYVAAHHFWHFFKNVVR